MQFLKWFLTALIIFLIGFLMVRLIGKRHVAHMSSLDLIMVSISASLLGNGLANKIGWMQAGVTAASFYAIYYVFTLLTLNNVVRRWIQDKPTVLISQGNINETGLRNARMTIAELMTQLRISGYISLADVEFAVLEDDGRVSVIPKAQKAPLSAQDLNLQKPPAIMPVPLVLSGEILKDNLRFLERDENWLTEQLHKQGLGIGDIPNLSLVQVEPTGLITIDKDEPKLLGKWLENNRSGQYDSRTQAQTAIMPSYGNIPGIAEETKKALHQLEHPQQTLPPPLLWQLSLLQQQINQLCQLQQQPQQLQTQLQQLDQLLMQIQQAQQPAQPQQPIH